jgi:hypothetical protein
MKKKAKLIEEHLLQYGSITSWEAIKKYNATRLSAIIFNLRKKYEIESVREEGIDMYGDECHFVRYYMRGVIN